MARKTAIITLALVSLIGAQLLRAAGSSKRRAVAFPAPVTVAAPVAAADTFSTAKGTVLNTPAPGVLANDTLNSASITGFGAVAGNEQTALHTATPTSQGGSIVLESDGSFSYTPPSGFSGTDTFRYTLTNAGGASTATVTFTVTAPAVTNILVISPGFFFSFSGVDGENPVLTLVRGRTYTFDVDTDSVHPFQIQNAPAGTVINNNIHSGTITFNVPNTAATYHYHCSIHDFGNSIVTVAP